jgi:hypothetical protein
MHHPTRRTPLIALGLGVDGALAAANPAAAPRLKPVPAAP